jgi:hypothetical protein
MRAATARTDRLRKNNLRRNNNSYSMVCRAVLNETIRQSKQADVAVVSRK